jgi:N-acyl-L-homoserine lactone synthetase
MIRIVPASKRSLHSREIFEMHELRRIVFADRLEWDVTITDGLEIDSFDEVDPLYVLSLDPHTGSVRGTLRLLPTTGPNMLRDVFHCLLPDGERIESATIWESSRFAVHPDFAGERSNNRLNRITGELFAALVEIGMLAGLQQIVSVYDARMRRVLNQVGYPAETIGTPQRIGKVMTYAGLGEVSEMALRKIQIAAGITGSVLEPESAQLLMPEAA